ncbi:hypothetical protein JD844_026051 [Phrynosoma platyrhinos]|uniref:C-type lectin domain-containing protein n=1 Tax=Phrynosoma platyrhinos TaxID=52577 RepID=A0ABQ7SEG5_PHRPL|nr:hypothetical protein JD844_026051 [Phrynosoma platyrhinos]
MHLSFQVRCVSDCECWCGSAGTQPISKRLESQGGRCMGHVEERKEGSRAAGGGCKRRWETQRRTMGPKAKADPKGKAAPAKGAPPAAAQPGGGPFSNIPPKVLWSIIGMVAVISFAVLITMTYLYISLASQKKHPLDEPMKKLRSTMAIGLRSPQLNYENLALFKKGARSSGGWQLFGKNLYYISKGQKTWYDAENFCMSRDSHLTSILSEEEQNYINSQLKRSTWIGLSDEEVEDRLILVLYWSSGHPKSSWDYGEEEKDCTSIEPLSSGPNWSEANCHELKRWVCKESLEIKRP